MSAEDQQTIPTTDPAKQRLARIQLAILLVVVIGGGVGGYFGLQAYRADQDAKAIAAIEAEGGMNGGRRPRGQRAQPGPIAPAVADQYLARMQLQQKQRLERLEAALATYKTTPDAHRDAFADRTVAPNPSQWRQVVNNPMKSADPAAAEFVDRLRAAVNRATRNRQAGTRPAANN